MKSIRILKTGLPIVSLLAAIAVFPGCRKSDSNEAAAVKPIATPVKVLKASRQKIAEKLTYTGTLEPWQKINITPENAGKVARILVEEGQSVQAGQLLAELDTKSIRLQLQQAEAGQAAAEANLANLTKNMERMERLRKEKAVSDQQYEQVKLGFDAAKAQLDQARAAVDLARHYLDTSLMRAPWSGVVSSKNAQVGDVINPMMGGFSPASGVLTLMDFSRIKIVLEVGPGEIGRIRKGQPAVVKVADGEVREFPASVSLVTQTADALAKKFRVEISAANPGGALRPGTFGTVVLDVVTREAALVLPQKAIIGDKYVFLAEGGKAVRREVKLGLQNADQVEIIGGLKEGEMVIVEGNYGLSDGSAIDVR
jgi:RND family efflux transporter MFP subunit